MFGTLGKCAIENILACVGGWIRTVPGLIATGSERGHKQRQQVFERSLHWRDSLA